EQRVVGQRVSDPDRHGVAFSPPVMRPGPAALARDPLGVAARGRNLAVERHRGLEQHPGTAGPGVLTERLVEQPGPFGKITAGEHYFDAVVAQDPQPAARGMLAGILAGHHHALDAGLADGVGARWGAAMVATRLE